MGLGRSCPACDRLAPSPRASEKMQRLSVLDESFGKLMKGAVNVCEHQALPVDARSN